MARKVKSTIHATVFPGPDSPYFLAEADKFSPTPLPLQLSEPMKFQVQRQAYLEAKLERHAGQVELLKLQSATDAWLRDTLIERWAKLHALYGSDYSADGWRRLALGLARDFIPGMRIEYFTSSEAEDTERARVIELVLSAAKDLAKRRAGRSLRAARVPESKALDELWGHWSVGLGEKSETRGAFTVQFGRDKEKYQSIAAEMDLPSLRELGLRPPRSKKTPGPSLAALTPDSYKPAKRKL